jgi:tripartite-type tricarboxylate transporter receptor subunit TctC
MSWKISTVRNISAALFLAAASTGAAAQDYPSEPITLVVGFGAGGMTDTSSRIIAEELEKRLGVSIVVENRPGVGGLLALDEVQRRPADGYTFVTFLSDSPFTAAYQDKPLDFDQWTMLGGYMPQERVLFGRADNPFHTLEEFVAYAKDNYVTFADGGAFSSARVMEAFAKQHDLQLRLVPFKSGAEGSAAILGGHVMLAETGVGTPAWTSSKDDGLEVMATLSPGGLAEFGLEEVPTLQSFGADYVVDIQYGFAISSETPEDRVEILRNTLQEIAEDPAVQKRFREIDLLLKWTPADEYAEKMQAVAESAADLKAFLAE